MTAAQPSPDRVATLSAIARYIRRASIEATTAAGSGHPTSSMSCADILAVLFFDIMRIDPARPKYLGNDRFVLSKGHAAPALWAALSAAGVITREELLSLRRIDSEIEGHPTPRCDFIDVPTGSLGQGLSAGLGMTLWLRHLAIPSRVWVLLGDGECAEGSVWEAAMLAHHHQAERLCAIVDVNALGQTGPTMPGHDCEVYAQRFKAFGWSTAVIDGHDIASLRATFEQISTSGGPWAVIARTVKGKGVRFLEGDEDRHGKALEKDEYTRALAEIGEQSLRIPVAMRAPEVITETMRAPAEPTTADQPQLTFADPVATRSVYGDTLAATMSHDGRLLAFDAEVSNSTGAGTAQEKHPQRFIECYIAEQNMVGMALGCAALGAIPCISTFAAFLTRAADQLRMAGLSGHHLVVAGSHSGVSIGEDGPSQMGLEDIALFRAINGARVLCPADGVSTARLFAVAVAAEGVCYLRLTRPKRPLIYDAGDRDFRLGGSRVLRQDADDQVTVVACGICVHEALQAAGRLREDGIRIRVVDAYSIQPLDVAGIASAVGENGRLITVEDHYRAGGLGEAVAAQVLPMLPGCRFHQLAVSGIPRSGSEEAQLARHGLDADSIIRACKAMALMTTGRA